jgi:hypothetical protein
MKRVLAFAGVGLALSLAPAIAHAQDSAAAEALFQKGHQLFEAKDYAAACPKFAESFRLDPVTGSLLALAACHEAEGKLASAWAEYLDVATRARRDGKNDRADATQARAATLEPKLARITISLAPGAEEIQGLVVKRDGNVVGSGAFGTPLPVDRGEHTVEATAPGRQPFSKTFAMQDGAKEAVAIPALLPGAVAADPTPLPKDKPHATSGPLPLRTIGIVVGAVGLVTVGIGGYFGATAISKNGDSNKDNHCVSDRCDATGKKIRLDAISAGNTSTALFVVGGVLAAGGVALYILGGSSGGADAKPAALASPLVSPDTAGLGVSGRF